MKTNSGYAMVFLCLFLLLPQRSMSAADDSPPLVLKRAEYVRQKEENEHTVIIMVGSVEWERGDSRLDCERSKYYEDKGILYLSGNIHLLDEGRDVQADSVRYLDETECAVVMGNVRLEMSNGDFALLADSLDYSLRQREAWAFKRPELVLSGRGKEENSRMDIVVTGNWFHLLEDSLLAISGDVDICGDSLLGGADSLYYDMGLEEILLVGTPWIETGDYRLEGERLDLSVPGRTLKRGISRGSARGEQKEVILHRIEDGADEELLNWIEADSIVLSFKDERIDSLIASSEARSFYSDMRQGELEENYAVGDEILLVWGGTGMDLIQVSGRGYGVYRKRDEAEE